MKRTYSLMLAGMMALVPVTRAVDRVVTAETGTGAGSLTAAINALLDGDRITFNIPPNAGEVHYVQVPPDGWPLITKNNITIDGFTQSGATPNTNGIHGSNTCVLKIVLCATNRNALSMYHAVTNYAGFNYPNLGFTDTEQAILGFFKATNAWVKGFAIIADPLPETSQSPDPGRTGVNQNKAFCFAPDAPDISSNSCQGFHVSGCWFGLDPVSGQVVIDPVTGYVDTPRMSVATYGTGTNGTVPGYTGPTDVSASGTFGVAPRSALPRAEFNVVITPYGFDSQGGPYNVSGNFWGILPDGVTGADMTDLGLIQITSDAYFECGGPHDVVIGTDGDGINDADEGNIFGKYANADADVEFYGTQYNIVFAGNTFGADINGKSLETGIAFPANKVLYKISSAVTGQIRFGSDFNGVSDALEANTVVESALFVNQSTSSTNSHWLSMRGNSLTNSADASGGFSPANRPPIGDGQTLADGLNLYTNFIDASGGTLNIIPVIGAATTTSLSGTCGLPLRAPYTNLVVDVYLADPDPTHPPQGLTWKGSFTDNSTADSNPAVGAFTFDITSLGLAHGAKVTMTVSYVSKTQPTIASVSRSGSQSTVKINNPGTATYGIQKSATVGPTSWASAGAAIGGTATFTDSSSPKSFYRAQGPTASGQTSPFSDVYTVP